MDGDGAAVTIVDRVTLPRDASATWLARLHREYRPGAEARGLHLAGVWETRADHPRAVALVVVWTAREIRDFWKSRAGATDPAVAAWWRATDELALGRSREVMHRTEVPPE